jgi:hypothetical protein
VQPLKDTEELMSIAHVEAYTVVFDTVDVLGAGVLATHFNTGDLTLTGELDSIREEVNQDPALTRPRRPGRPAGPKHDVNPPPCVCSAYVSEHLVHEVSKPDRLLVPRLAAQT